MACHIINGVKYNDEEYNQYQREQAEARQRAREHATRLVRELSQAYKACNDFMDQNPELNLRLNDAQAREHDLYEKLRRNLEAADRAPRCAKVREDGTRCGCPQMNGHNYCYAHERMLRARARKFELPPLEDANAIQMAIMLVQRALIDDEISEKKAGLLLYSLQLATSNVPKTTFCEEDDAYLQVEPERDDAVGEHTINDRTVWSSRYEEAVTTPPSAFSPDEEESITEARLLGDDVGCSLPPVSADEGREQAAPQSA